MAEKVPMHPRNLLSRPIFHVTNSGLGLEQERRPWTWGSGGWSSRQGDPHLPFPFWVF